MFSGYLNSTTKELNNQLPNYLHDNIDIRGFLLLFQHFKKCIRQLPKLDINHTNFKRRFKTKKEKILTNITIKN